MRRKLLIVSAASVVLVALLAALTPAIGRWYVKRKVLPAVSRRVQGTVTAGEIEVHWGRLVLRRLVVRHTLDPADGPLLRAREVRVRFAPLDLLRGRRRAQRVAIDAPRLVLLRQRDGQANFSALLGHRAKERKQSTAAAAVWVGQITLTHGTLRLTDQENGTSMSVENIDGHGRPGGQMNLRLRSVRLRLPMFRDAVQIADVGLQGPVGRGRGLPRVTLSGGQLQLLPRLRLTGIKGEIAPRPGETRQLAVSLRGSYGGAEARLWRAVGWLSRDLSAGALELSAKRFSLGRIASILKRTPVILPQQTLVRGQLHLAYKQGKLTMGGELGLERLSLFHPLLARTPVLDLNGGAKLDAVLDLPRRKLLVRALDLTFRGLDLHLTGEVTNNGSPKLKARVQLPAVACQKVLDAVPPSLVPALEGFKLRGRFKLDLATSIDFAEREKATIGGEVGYRRCKVVQAPEHASAERLRGSFEHQVEPVPGQQVVFQIGPENERFAPYASISPNVVNAFLTTEDGGFFRHRGFLPSMMKKAFARNLKRGGFRLGASTISMQMVKNVLLSHEKTLSRKLQELFLTWYLEGELSKERIMEIYLNAIEFGPGIYGIGAAAQHYFGKLPSEITPLEAAFFATILPSPKRRYIQYCRGQLSERWDRYVRRILRRMASKGFVTPEQLKAAGEQTLTFNRDQELMSVEQCRKQLDELLEDWDEANTKRFRDAVLQSAPNRAALFLPAVGSNKSIKNK